MTAASPYRYKPGSVRLTVLVENSVQQPGLLAEHGWAVWLEAGGLCILFDTGQSDLLVRNAARLAVCLDTVDVVALSHGHYDHGGGLEGVLNLARVGTPIYAHPAALRPKFHRTASAMRDIGLPATCVARLQAPGTAFHPVTAPTEIAPGVWLTGPIPRRHPAEAPEAGFCLDPEGRIDDELVDDQALVVQTAAGCVVVLGCAHAGLINTLEQVAALGPGEPVRAVVGGLHLRSAPPERVAWTIEALRRFDTGVLCPAHCTGAAALVALWSAFPGRCAVAGVGTVLEF
jgi:7,8-dihydropterin-6-yl-methyl-4-(beta-D-ribofuranosyl)aminobenzene 5'-phosphate synthase